MKNLDYQSEQSYHSDPGETPGTIFIESPKLKSKKSVLEMTTIFDRSVTKELAAIDLKLIRRSSMYSTPLQKLKSKKYSTIGTCVEETEK